MKIQGHPKESIALVNKHHSLHSISHIGRHESLQSIIINVIINTRYEIYFEYLMSNDWE